MEGGTATARHGIKMKKKKKTLKAFRKAISQEPEKKAVY